MIIWYMYISWNDYQNKVSYFATSQNYNFLIWWEYLISTLLASFNYIILTIITMLYIRSTILIHLRNGSLYPLTKNSSFPHLRWFQCTDKFKNHCSKVNTALVKLYGISDVTWPNVTSNFSKYSRIILQFLHFRKCLHMTKF